MITPNLDLVLSVAEDRTRQVHRRVKVDGLLREAGLSRPSARSRRMRRLLSIMGHTLIILGKRLEACGMQSVAAAVENSGSASPARTIVD
jgi:hypothetical protein